MRGTYTKYMRSSDAERNQGEVWRGAGKPPESGRLDGLTGSPGLASRI